MSPGMLALLRSIQRDTVRLAAMHIGDRMRRYPRDYYRPLPLLQMQNRYRIALIKREL